MCCPSAVVSDIKPANIFVTLAAIADLARGHAASVLTLTDAIQPRTFVNCFVPILR
jgi:hypothetical protein